MFLRHFVLLYLYRAQLASYRDARMRVIGFFALFVAFVHCKQRQEEIWIRGMKVYKVHFNRFTGDSVGKSCRTSADCATDGARCFAGQCLCLSTHIAIRGRCMPSECLYSYEMIKTKRRNPPRSESMRVRRAVHGSVAAHSLRQLHMPM